MANSQQSISDKAFRIAASRQTDPHASPLVDAEWLTEDRFRDALRQAVIEQNFERSYALTLASGEVALPSGVILEKMKTATVRQTSDEGDGEQSSYEERYIDYLNFIFPQLSRFTVRNSKFCYSEPGGEPASFSGGVTLQCVALPDLSTVTTTIVIPDTVADRCSEILAEMLLS